LTTARIFKDLLVIFIHSLLEIIIARIISLNIYHDSSFDIEVFVKLIAKHLRGRRFTIKK